MNVHFLGKRIVELRHAGYGRWVAKNKKWWEPEPSLDQTLTLKEWTEYRELLRLFANELRQRRSL